MFEMPENIWRNLTNAAMDEAGAASKKNSWAVALGLAPKRDGTQWCVLWGENLQEGVAGFGSTPAEALIAFDSAMHQCGGHSTVPKR